MIYHQERINLYGKQKLTIEFYLLVLQMMETIFSLVPVEHKVTFLCYYSIPKDLNQFMYVYIFKNNIQNIKLTFCSYRFMLRIIVVVLVSVVLNGHRQMYLLLLVLTINLKNLTYVLDNVIIHLMIVTEMIIVHWLYQ